MEIEDLSVGAKMTTVEGDGFWVKETAAFFGVLARLKIEISILPLCFLFSINR